MPGIFYARHLNSGQSCGLIRPPIEKQTKIVHYSNGGLNNEPFDDWTNTHYSDPHCTGSLNLFYLKKSHFYCRTLARKYNTGISEYWDFIDTYADLSTPEGQFLLENHLTQKLREFEEEESEKILELERDLADLNIDSKDLSFCSTLHTGPEFRGLSQTDVKSSTNFLLNDHRNANLVRP